MQGTINVVTEFVAEGARPLEELQAEEEAAMKQAEAEAAEQWKKVPTCRRSPTCGCSSPAWTTPR